MNATDARGVLVRRYFMLIPLLALLWTASASTSLHGVIDSPSRGEKVGREMNAHGTLNPAIGYHFWLLARAREYDPLWYPQREIQPDLTTGKWTALVTFGEPRDVGKTFDIALIAVKPSGHQLLRKHWLDCMASGNWRPMELPPGAEVLATRDVHKARP